MSDLFVEGEPGAGLIVALHPGAARASWARSNMGFHELDAASCLYPDGDGWLWKHWNVGRALDGTPCFGGSNVGHAGILAATIRDLYLHGGVSGPLLVVGFSEGAALAHALTDSWSIVGPPSVHVATVAGHRVNLDTPGVRHGYPMLHVHGTDDSTWPLEGGRILTGTWPLFARVPSVAQVAALYGPSFRTVTHTGGHSWEPWIGRRVVEWWRA